MDQTYTQYTGETNLTTANGTVYPTEFNDKIMLSFP
ncbi:hypothetical protein [Ligilactobacillus murinus]